MSYGVGCRCDSDLTLLWLCCRLAAVALIRPLAWEPPYASGVALEKTKQKTKIKKHSNHYQHKKTRKSDFQKIQKARLFVQEKL